MEYFLKHLQDEQIMSDHFVIILWKPWICPVPSISITRMTDFSIFQRKSFQKYDSQHPHVRHLSPQSRTGSLVPLGSYISWHNTDNPRIPFRWIDKSFPPSCSFSYGRSLTVVMINAFLVRSCCSNMNANWSSRNWAKSSPVSQCGILLSASFHSGTASHSYQLPAEAHISCTNSAHFRNVFRQILVIFQRFPGAYPSRHPAQFVAMAK